MTLCTSSKGTVLVVVRLPMCTRALATGPENVVPSTYSIESCWAVTSIPLPNPVGRRFEKTRRPTEPVSSTTCNGFGSLPTFTVMSGRGSSEGESKGTRTVFTCRASATPGLPPVAEDGWVVARSAPSAFFDGELPEPPEPLEPPKPPMASSDATTARTTTAAAIGRSVLLRESFVRTLVRFRSPGIRGTTGPGREGHACPAV